MITFLPTIQGRSKAKSCWKINSKCDSHVAGSWDWGIHLIGVNVMVVHSLIKVALTWVGNRNSWGTRRFCCCCLFFSLIFLSMCVKFVCVGGKGHQKRQIFLSKEIFTYSLEQRGNLVTKIKISEESKGQNEKSQHYEVRLSWVRLVLLHYDLFLYDRKVELRWSTAEYVKGVSMCLVLWFHITTYWAVNSE